MNNQQSRMDPSYPPQHSPPSSKLYSQPTNASDEPLNTAYMPPAELPTQPAPYQPPRADRPHHSTMRETEDELTEDERIEYEKGILTWSKMRGWRFWFRREWLWWYLLGIVIVLIVALMVFFHRAVSQQLYRTLAYRLSGHRL